MHYSAQIALNQVIVAILLFLFVIYWAILYDRYAVIKVFRINLRKEREVAGRWNRQVFKRLMVYCYILGLPALGLQGGWYAWIKYEVGFYPATLTGNPVDYHQWPAHYRSHIGALQIIAAVGWAAEIIVHLEELMFFLHLVSLNATSRPWFRSWHFCITVVGAVVAFGTCLGIIGGYWDNPLRGEAVFFLFVSSIVIITSVAFFRIMYVFPRFLAELRTAGGTSEVLIRLKGWHELNKIRIPARLLFGIPLFILAVDGCTDARVLNRHIVWVDTFLFIALWGFAVQAVITLLIFLPRSWSYELGLRTPSPSSFDTPSLGPTRPPRQSHLDLGSPRRPFLHHRRRPPVAHIQAQFPSDGVVANNESAEETASTAGTLHVSLADWPSLPAGHETAGPATEGGGKRSLGLSHPPFPPSTSKQQGGTASFAEHLYPPAPSPFHPAAAQAARSRGDLSRPPLNFMDTSSSSTGRDVLAGAHGGFDLEAGEGGGRDGGGRAPFPGVVVTRETQVAVSSAPGVARDGDEEREADGAGKKKEDDEGGNREGGSRRTRVEEVQPSGGEGRVEGGRTEVGTGRTLPESWRYFTSPIDIV